MSSFRFGTAGTENRFCFTIACVGIVKSFIGGLCVGVWVVESCVLLRKSPESSRTATEERTAYRLAVPAVLAGIRHAG